MDVKLNFAGQELNIGKWIRNEETSKEVAEASLKEEAETCGAFYKKAKEVLGRPSKNQSEAFKVFEQLEEEEKKSLVEIALLWGVKYLHETDPVIVGNISVEEAFEQIEEIDF